MADEEDKGEELSIEIVGEELEDGLRITVFEHEEVVGTVTAKLLEQLGVWHGGFIVFGEDPIEPGLSFNEVGIDDGARLSLSPQSVFERAVADMLKLNPLVTETQLKEGACWNKKTGDMYFWNLGCKGLEFLPPSMGSLVIKGDLNLAQNKLERNIQPSEFLRIKVEGDLIGCNFRCWRPAEFEQGQLPRREGIDPEFLEASGVRDTILQT